jgi:7-cyano-7-deazaguanine synthase
MRAILLSGGIDSAALAFWQKPELAINVNYGQRAAGAERRASQSIARALNIDLKTIDVDCSSLGSGDLAGNGAIRVAPVSEWWPYRNQLLITLAAMICVGAGANELMLGAVSTDKRHADGTPGFFSLMNEVCIYQEGALKITVPGIKLNSLQLIKRSGVSPAILSWTHSCHTSDYPCGNCNGCRKHLSIKSKLNLI